MLMEPWMRYAIKTLYVNQNVRLFFYSKSFPQEDVGITVGNNPPNNTYETEPLYDRISEYSIIHKRLKETDGQVDNVIIVLTLLSCHSYFVCNPQKNWFKQQEKVITLILNSKFIFI